jgi:hypothetical protein
MHIGRLSCAVNLCLTELFKHFLADNAASTKQGS